MHQTTVIEKEHNILDTRRTIFWIPGGHWNGYQEDNVLDPRSIVQLCHKILICLHTHIGIGKATVVELNRFGEEVYLGRCWMRLVEVKRSLDGVWDRYRQEQNLLQGWWAYKTRLISIRLYFSQDWRLFHKVMSKEACPGKRKSIDTGLGKVSYTILFLFGTLSQSPSSLIPDSQPARRWTKKMWENVQLRREDKWLSYK